MLMPDIVCVTVHVSVCGSVHACVYSEVFQGAAESALPRNERELKVPHIHCLYPNAVNLAT